MHGRKFVRMQEKGLSLEALIASGRHIRASILQEQ
jgi:hypothetical protein